MENLGLLLFCFIVRCNICKLKTALFWCVLNPPERNKHTFVLIKGSMYNEKNPKARRKTFPRNDDELTRAAREDGSSVKFIEFFQAFTLVWGSEAFTHVWSIRFPYFRLLITTRNWEFSYHNYVIRRKPTQNVVPIKIWVRTTKL